MSRNSKTGRNELCPCGSGLKYKKCCLRKNQKQPVVRKLDQIPVGALKQMQEQLRKEAEWESKYGKIREPVHVDFEGHKIVAVGNGLFYSPLEKTRTFIDFLAKYIKWKLGEEWGAAEEAKPFEERHPIMKLFELTGRYTQLQHMDANGLYASKPSGPMKAYLLLARDLYVVQDNLALQDFMIKRLKDPNQYKGARNELSAIATCFIAGCTVDFEDESDKSRKHCEFIATHVATGQKIAIEAKSRNRDIQIEGKVPEDFPSKLGLDRIIGDAFKKNPSEPYVIFLDLDLPPLGAPIMDSPYFMEWVKTIKNIDRRRDDLGDPFSLIIMVNRPFIYGDWDKPAPRHEVYGYEAENPAIKVVHPKALVDISEASMKYCEIPSFFPE